MLSFLRLVLAPLSLSFVGTPATVFVVGTFAATLERIAECIARVALHCDLSQRRY